MPLERGYSNSTYRFNAERAKSVIEAVLPLSEVRVPEDDFFDKMRALNYSEVTMANILSSTTILTSAVSSKQLFARLMDNLPHAQEVYSQEQYTELINMVDFVFKNASDAYHSLIDRLFSEDSENPLKGDIRNVFDPHDGENVTRLCEFDRVSEKTANLLILNLAHYGLMTGDYAELAHNFDEIRLPVDRHTIQVALRTGILSSTTGSIYPSMAGQFLRPHFDEVIEEMLATPKYAGMTKLELTNKIHRGFYNLGANNCTLDDFCGCAAKPLCTEKYSKTGSRYDITPIKTS
jgi:hypothetical protein